MEDKHPIEPQGFERVDHDLVLEIGADGRVREVTDDDPEGQQQG